MSFFADPVTMCVQAILLCTLTLLILILPSFLFIPKPLANIPYTRSSAWLAWGDLFSLALHNFRTHEVFDWLDKQCIKHTSPIVQVFLPNYSITRPIVIVTDQQEIEDIVIRRSAIFDRTPLMHAWFDVLFPRSTVTMQTTPEFKEKRRLFHTVLQNGFMTNITAPYVFQASQRLVQLWERKMQAASGLPFEAYEDIQQTMVEMIVPMLTENHIDLLSTKKEQISDDTVQRRGNTAIFRACYPPLYNALQTLSFYLDLTTQGISPPVYMWIFQKLPTFRKAQKTMDIFLTQVIGASREKLLENDAADAGNVTCAIDQVLRCQPREGMPDYREDDEFLKDELLQLIIVGQSSTSSSPAWMLKWLADHPVAQHRLREALLTAYPSIADGGRSVPTLSDLLSINVPYLEAVIAETFRLSRVGPVSFRQTTVDTGILGRFVPAGTNVMLVTDGPSQVLAKPLSANAAERSESSRKSAHRWPNWPHRDDLHEFRPERWLGEEIDEKGRSRTSLNAKAGPLLPFSAGPRGCYGQKIAMMELRILLAMMVLRFNFVHLPPELSKYTSYDGLTRAPSCCYVKLESVHKADTVPTADKSGSP
jgi:cytochrome P450